MYLHHAALPVLVQDRNDEGVSLSWSGFEEVVMDIPIQITREGRSTMAVVPSNGERFPLPDDAILQIDPRVTILRDFGTSEACSSN